MGNNLRSSEVIIEKLDGRKVDEVDEIYKEIDPVEASLGIR